MSIKGMANTYVNIYRVVNSKDIYAAHKESHYLIYANVPVRIRMLKKNFETFIDGKEMSPSQYRLYIPYQLDIRTTDLIIDTVRNRKYDVKYNYKLDKKRHMQVDALRCDSWNLNITYLSSSSSSSSSTEYLSSSSSSQSTQICPNIITGWNSTIIRVA